MKINYICEIIAEKCKNITSSVIKFKYFSKHYWVGSVDADKLGRWTWITLQGSNSESIMIYKVYNLCTATAPSPTSIRQHIPDPRRQSIADFNSILKEHKQHQGQMIIMADLNEELGTDLSGFAAFCAEYYNLANIHTHFHPS
jgi:hypothetical protein